jgi:DNA primase
MNVDPNATKYLIRARITADGVIEKPDVVGAVFGQTEGLLGDELDLRDLQKSGRVGRIEVEIDSKKGKSEGEVLIPSSLDQVETAILASGLETVDRIGPCKARIEVTALEDVRTAKRARIVERAKDLLSRLQGESKDVGADLAEEVRKSVQVEEIVSYGRERLPAGPNVDSSDAIIVVEGRSDVLNLLRCGIKNVIAVEGTSVPETVRELSRGKTVTAFTDGDRSGELILREMLQTMDLDFIARAPRGTEVEDLTQKQIMKCLRNKIQLQQYLEMTGFEATGASRGPIEERGSPGNRDGGGMRSERAPPPRRESPEPSGPSGGRAPMPAVRPVPEPPAPRPTAPAVSPRLGKFFDDLGALENPSRARLLGEQDNILSEIPAKDVVDTLVRSEGGIKTLIFDGVVSQRLLDVAQEKGVQEVVAVRLGSIGKMPEGIRVYTRSDLEVPS